MSIREGSYIYGSLPVCQANFKQARLSAGRVKRSSKQSVSPLLMGAAIGRSHTQGLMLKWAMIAVTEWFR